MAGRVGGRTGHAVGKMYRSSQGSAPCWDAVVADGVEEEQAAIGQEGLTVRMKVRWFAYPTCSNMPTETILSKARSSEFWSPCFGSRRARSGPGDGHRSGRRRVESAVREGEAGHRAPWRSAAYCTSPPQPQPMSRIRSPLASSSFRQIRSSFCSCASSRLAAPFQ